MFVWSRSFMRFADHPAWYIECRYDGERDDRSIQVNKCATTPEISNIRRNQNLSFLPWFFFPSSLFQSFSLHNWKSENSWSSDEFFAGLTFIPAHFKASLQLFQILDKTVRASRAAAAWLIFFILRKTNYIQSLNLTLNIYQIITMSKGKVCLAYSGIYPRKQFIYPSKCIHWHVLGGLDTSCILKWLLGELETDLTYPIGGTNSSQRKDMKSSASLPVSHLLWAGRHVLMMLRRCRPGRGLGCCREEGYQLRCWEDDHRRLAEGIRRRALLPCYPMQRHHREQISPRNQFGSSSHCSWSDSCCPAWGLPIRKPWCYWQGEWHVEYCRFPWILTQWSRVTIKFDLNLLSMLSSLRSKSWHHGEIPNSSIDLRAETICWTMLLNKESQSHPPRLSHGQWVCALSFFIASTNIWKTRTWHIAHTKPVFSRIQIRLHQMTCGLWPMIHETPQIPLSKSPSTSKRVSQSN